MLHQPEPFIPFRDWIRRHPKISPYYIRAVCISVSFLYGSKEKLEIAAWIRNHIRIHIWKHFQFIRRDRLSGAAQVSHQMQFDVIKKNPVKLLNIFITLWSPNDCALLRQRRPCVDFKYACLLLFLNYNVSTKPHSHIYSLAFQFCGNRGGFKWGECRINHIRNTNSFKMRNLDSARYGCSKMMFHTENYDHLINSVHAGVIDCHI